MPLLPAFLPGHFAQGHFAPTYFAPTYFGGATGRPPIFVPASPAGWKSKGTRGGPDPYFTTGSRLAGPGSD